MLFLPLRGDFSASSSPDTRAADSFAVLFQSTAFEEAVRALFSAHPGAFLILRSGMKRALAFAQHKACPKGDIGWDKPAAR